MEDEPGRAEDFGVSRNTQSTLCKQNGADSYMGVILFTNPGGGMREVYCRKGKKGAEPCWVPWRDGKLADVFRWLYCIFRFQALSYLIMAVPPLALHASSHGATMFCA